MSTLLLPVLASAQAGIESAYPLDTLIAAAVEQHPAVLAARAQERALAEDEQVARLQRYPAVSLQTETSGARPATVLSVEQTLWAGGRLTAQIEAAQAFAAAQAAQVNETRYMIALRIVDAWQALVAAQGKIASIELIRQRLRLHFELMQRRVAAQVSPPIEQELIASRMARLQVDLAASEASRRLALARLELLLGAEYAAKELVGPRPIETQVRELIEMLAREPLDQFPQSVDEHPTIRKAQLQARALQHQFEAAQASQWPQVYARLQHPLGSSGIVVDKSLFIGLRYTPGAGFSSLAQARGALARTESQQIAVQTARRELRDAMRADIEEINSARGRIEALQASIHASTQVLSSYERQFIAGRRTWLEVLNAVREDGEHRSALADAGASLLGAAYRLRVRAGQLPWQKEVVS